MRRDMSKVVTERYRYGSRNTGRFKKDNPENIRHISSISRNIFNNGYIDDLDDIDTFSKWSTSPRRNHYEWKEFSDLLGPLERFLNKQIGRKWDDVYSEICKNLPNTSMAGDHIRQHVFQIVEIHTFLGLDNKIYQKPKYGGGFVEISSYSRKQQLYVHPVTGILLLAKRRKRTKHVGEITKITNKNLPGWYEKFDGIWYEMKTSMVQRFLPLATEQTFELVEEEIKHKRQMSHKELSKAGLKNDLMGA